MEKATLVKLDNDTECAFVNVVVSTENVITIATNKLRRSGKFGRVMIHYVKAYVEPNERNIPLLQILDTIKNVEHIQDSSISDSLIILSKIIENLSSGQRLELLDLARKYPPRVRALTGLIVENVSEQNGSQLERLKNTIIGKGKYQLKTKKLPFKNNVNWNIYEFA